MTDKNNPETLPVTSTIAPKDTPALVKKIGKTTYIVHVHFSTTSKATMEDKIHRMLRNEVRQMMKNE